MRAHVLAEDGRIIDTIMVDSVIPGQWDAAIGGTIGDYVINGQLIPGQHPTGPSFEEQKAEYFGTVREMR